MYSELRERALWAENAGFDFVTVMDHTYQISLIGPRDEPFMEGWLALAALAEATQNVGLGTLVTGVGYRNVALLARMFGTLDLISGGRAFLGIGAGWNREEFDSYGYGHWQEFPRPSKRIAQLRDAVKIIKALWEESRTTYVGEHHSVREAILEPKPIGRPRLLIAGGGERLMAQLVAEEADACNFFGSPQDVRHKSDVLKARCEEINRDFSEIEMTKWDVVVMGADEKIAEEKWRRRGRPSGGYRGLVGTPEEVIKLIGEFEQVGVETMFLSFPGNDWESRELFVREVMPAVQHPAV